MVIFKRVLSLVTALLLFCLLPATASATLHLSADLPRLSLEGRLDHFADPDNTLPFEIIRQKDFTRLPGYRSLGYDTQAHWFRVELNPAADAPSRWVLAMGSPELEEVDVWVEQQGGSFRQYALGYHRPYENRPVRSRLFVVATDVFPGMQMYFRVRTNNAILVKADLWQVDAFTAHETRTNFYYGLYFGILLIAVLLYAILGTRLRDLTMAAYAGYVASQLLFHLGTTGYLPVLLTWQAGLLMDVLPRIGWIGSAVSIVLMWGHLMDLRQTYPNIQRLFCFTVVLYLALLPFALMPFLVGAWLLPIVKLANLLSVLNFAISMGLLLLLWQRTRRMEWMIYFIAFVIPAVGMLVNTAVNQGMFPLNGVTSNFYQIAPLAHVLVMSYGLALRLRQLQYDKQAAEQEATVASRRAEEQRRFVAMLSHEFGNPLAAIDRAAQMIQIKAGELPPAEAQRLAQIRHNAATLSGFVDNFLMTEALEHGALALSREPCAIRPLLETALRAQGEANEKRLRLGACPDHANALLDATLLGIAIGNLLANALHYSPPGSPVTLSARLEADHEGSSEWLCIQVSDEGEGLSAEELEKLGTPWFRAASSFGKKGSGLGYHFTRRIVEAHGGRLTAWSPEGAGLEVEICLPLGVVGR